MARFVETFKDWIVSYPNRYKLTENGQEKTVEIKRDWEPDVEGTSNNERVMNELVKNITYDTDTVHTTESGTSVYICDLVGMKEFIEYSSSDSSFIPKISARINTANSNQLSKIRFSGKDGSVIDYDLYTINNGVYSLLGTNKLKPNTIVVIKIVSNGANKIAVIQYLMDNKLDKGTYLGKADDLKTEIDGKLDKGGYGGDAKSLSDSIEELKKNKLPKGGYDKTAHDLYYENFNSIGGIVGSFPLTTAVKNGVYTLEATLKRYICTKDYSGPLLSVPNENFTEINIYNNKLLLNYLTDYKRDTISSNNFTLIFERYGRMCTVTMNSYTPDTKQGTITSIPSWAIPVETKVGGCLCGNDPTQATGEMYIGAGGFEWYVSSITGLDMYTGQITYVARD